MMITQYQPHVTKNRRGRRILEGNMKGRNVEQEVVGENKTVFNVLTRTLQLCE